jgi:hypothetical protein
MLNLSREVERYPRKKKRITVAEDRLSIMCLSIATWLPKWMAPVTGALIMLHEGSICRCGCTGRHRNDKPDYERPQAVFMERLPPLFADVDSFHEAELSDKKCL